MIDPLAPFTVKYGEDNQFQTEFADMADLLIDALNTDGDWHKQWFLYLALQVLDPRAAQLYRRGGGDVGTPP